MIPMVFDVAEEAAAAKLPDEWFGEDGDFDLGSSAQGDKSASGEPPKVEDDKQADKPDESQSKAEDKTQPEDKPEDKAQKPPVPGERFSEVYKRMKRLEAELAAARAPKTTPKQEKSEADKLLDDVLGVTDEDEGESNQEPKTALEKRLAALEEAEHQREFQTLVAEQGTLLDNEVKDISTRYPRATPKRLYAVAAQNPTLDLEAYAKAYTAEVEAIRAEALKESGQSPAPTVVSQSNQPAPRPKTIGSGAASTPAPGTDRPKSFADAEERAMARLRF